MRRALIALVLVGCGSSGPALPAATCNPLGNGHCLAPWPSSAFEVDDPSTPTGRRLAIPMGSLPTNIDMISADPTPWNQADGFSPAAPIVAAFPGGVSADGLPGNDNFDSSITMSSATVLLDLTTGTRVPHFAELDMQATSTPDSQALFIRPAQRLIGGHRYGVAITKNVKAAGGGDLPIPAGYKALLDGNGDHPLLDRARFADLTTALATAGYDVKDLVLAWDFTVASDDYIHKDMLAVQQRTLDALANHPIGFTITSDAPIDNGAVIARKITGTLDAPLFLSENGGIGDDTVIVRDADGLPAVQGFYQIPFTAIVPACASTAPAPVGMVMYGHGLMGDSSETAGGVQQTTASELCMVIAGTDLRGMSEVDVPAVALALNDMTNAGAVFEKLEQGLANHITLAHALETTFADQMFTQDGTSLVDKSKVYYYGLSQGAIFGTPIMAYEKTITRAVLGVGAANYSLLLERSTDWPMYRIILNGAYPDALDDTLAINLFQMRWDKVEGSGVVDVVLDGTATNVPPKQILMQMALGDDEVANVATLWEVRSEGVPILGPTPATPWGLNVQMTPLAGGSALVIMDGGAPPPPTTNVPAPPTGMHDLTRTQPATRRQMKEFYASGMIVDECAGACVCQSGACE